jgi:membrane associated rhomboid family serine protease
MASIADDIKQSFRHGTAVTKLIYINLGVFIVVRLLDVFLRLFSVEGFSLLPYLELPASFSAFIRRPWTIITYMFLHYDFFHIIFNLFFLYWFGRLFLSYYNPKQLVGLYILGGILGGLFFLAAYNLVPFFMAKRDISYLMGASGAILAITLGIAATVPNLQIRLILLGNVKLKYLALVIVLISLINVTSTNGGGHITHLGGALAGYLFAAMMQRGKDITAWVNKPIDFFVNLFRRKPKMRVTYGGGAASGAHAASDLEYNRKRKADQERVDAILDKVKQSGYSSLTAAEKKILFDESQK